MRFVLLALLVFCAFGARGDEIIEDESFEELSNVLSSRIEHRSIILQPVLAFIKNVTYTAKKAIQFAVKKTEDIVANIRDKIEKITAGAINKVKNIAQGVEDRFTKLAAKNKAVKQCFDTYNPLIKSAIKDLEENCELCVRGTFEQAKHISDDVQQHVESIQDHIDAMQDLIADCLETNGKIFGAAKCLWKQARDFNTNIFQMIGNGKDLVVDAAKRAVEIVSDGTKCVVDAARTGEKEISNSVKNLEGCIMGKAKPKAMSEFLIQ